MLRELAHNANHFNYKNMYLPAPSVFMTSFTDIVQIPMM